MCVLVRVFVATASELQRHGCGPEDFVLSHYWRLVLVSRPLFKDLGLNGIFTESGLSLEMDTMAVLISPVKTEPTL